MKVLVTGGSGFLGTHLLRMLSSEGTGALVSLDLVPYPLSEPEKLEILSGDIRDSSAVRHAMEGVDAVVHAAAALPLYSPEDIRTTEVDGTALLLEEAEQHRVNRFIFISTSAVYGVPDHHPLREEDPLDGVGPYGRAKIEAETLCRNARGRGMTITILRPKTFVGPERLGVFSLLFRWAREGRSFPLIGKGDNRYQLLDVEDLCRLILVCLRVSPEQADSEFNVGARVFGSIREDFQAVLDAAGCGRRLVPLPAPLMRTGLRILSALRLSPLYPWVYDTAGRESWLAIDKAAEQLGFEPLYSNREALLRNYEWYVTHITEESHSRGLGHRDVWKEGMLNFIRLFF